MEKKSHITLYWTLHLFVPHSVFGPQGLWLVRLADVSLLVEWEPVPGAEYYILNHHPKTDERALQQVARALMSNREGRKFSSNRHVGLTKDSSSPQEELVPYRRADSRGHLRCPGSRRHQGIAQWSGHDWGDHRWALNDFHEAFKPELAWKRMSSSLVRKALNVCVVQAKDTWLMKIRENQKLQIVLRDQGRVVG